MSRILVIDDALSSLVLIEEYLNMDGQTVVTCQAGRQALKVASAEPFDLVITDIYMPDKDGLEVIGDLRKYHPKLPIIAVTGAEGAKDMRFVAKTLGASSTLHKPFTCEELREAIESTLSRSLKRQTPLCDVKDA
jgi:DNA-binding response OmpR family regulator